MKVYAQQRTEQETFVSIKSALKDVMREVQRWDVHGFIEYARITGSFAKGTNVQGGTDVDMLLSFHPAYQSAPVTIYKELFEHLRRNGFPGASASHVGIRLTVDGLLIDLIPARKHTEEGEDHRIFNRKTGEWTVTNLNTHTHFVATSSRLSEIRLMKLWRNQQELFFPSFVLELSVIEALKHNKPLQQTRDLDGHVSQILSFLTTDFVTASLVDPSNAKNIVSDDMLKIEKTIVSHAAQKALVGGWRQFMV